MHFSQIFPLHNAYYGHLSFLTAVSFGAEHPNVASVFLNKRRKLHTTHSWDFLGLERNGVIRKASVWAKALGEDSIIGNLDTGNEE